MTFLRVALACAALFFSALPASAQQTEDIPPCETSTGIPGRLFTGITSAIKGPPETRWIRDRDGLILKGTSAILASSTILEIGINVTGYVQGTAILILSDAEEFAQALDNVVHTCWVDVIDFDRELHGLDAVRAGTCLLAGDTLTPFKIGETRILQKETQLGFIQMGAGIFEIEHLRDRQIRVRALEKGVENWVIGAQLPGKPLRYSKSGFCTLVVE